MCGYVAYHNVIYLYSAQQLLKILTLAGIRTRQAICPLRKELWLAGCLGVEPRVTGSLWLRASMIGGCGSCPFLVILCHLPYN
jgi:hypothetical protein